MSVFEIAVLVFLGCLLVLFVEAAKGFLESKEAQEKEWEREELWAKAQADFDAEYGQKNPEAGD